MTYELHVLEAYVYGASNAVLYCMDSTLQRLRAVCAATARLILLLLMVAGRQVDVYQLCCNCKIHVL